MERRLLKSDCLNITLKTVVRMSELCKPYPNVKAVIPVDMVGAPANMERSKDSGYKGWKHIYARIDKRVM